MFKPKNTPLNNAIAGALAVPIGEILYALTVGRFRQIDWLKVAVGMVIVGLFVGLLQTFAARNGANTNDPT